MHNTLAAACLLLVSVVYAQYNITCDPQSTSFYDLQATDINGQNISFSQYKGKVVLALNVASFWGMTPTNYIQLNQLVQKFVGKNFVVLAFPCAQFYNQEPGSDAEIPMCLKYVRPGGNYTPEFPLFSKLMVNGAQTHPVYQYLKGACGPPTAYLGDLPYISWTPVMINDITWNFEKFLITAQGQPYKRYNPETEPLSLSSDIIDLLGQ